MPTLVSITMDRFGDYVALDQNGDVWRGREHGRTRGDDAHIEWHRLRSKFEEPGVRPQ